MPATSRAAYLLIDVAGTPCALPREAVSEVLPLPELFPPPVAGRLLAGFLNLGGAPVPVIDLARLFGLAKDAAEPGLYAHLILAADRATAFLVERVSDLVTVEPSALRPVPDARTLNGCVAAEFPRGDSLVHVLDPDRILTVEEAARLAALAEAARERLSSLSPILRPPA